MESPQRELELKLLKAAGGSRESLEIVVTRLSQYKFTDTSLGWIWTKLKGFHDKGELPSNNSMAGWIRVEQVEAWPILLEAVKDVRDVDPSESLQNDCEILRKYHAHEHLSSGMDKAVKTLMTGDIDGATDMLGRLAKGSPTNGTHIQAMSLIDWDSWFDGPKGVEGIPTGIKRLDDELMGGMSRGDLGLIFGVTGMGKSILGVNVGHHAMKHRFRVLHIDSENGQDLVRCRYIARIKGLYTKALQRRRVQTDDDMVMWARNNKVRLDAGLRIMSIGVSQTSFSELKGSVAVLADSGWKPDMVLFDSPDHVLLGGSDNIALDYKRLYEELKGWTQELDAALIAVTQAGKEAEGKIASSRHIAWGYDKARIADIIMAINPPLNKKGKPVPEGEMDGARSLYVSKARSSASRFMVKMKTDFARARISQDLDGEVHIGN